MKRGDIYLVPLDPAVGREQKGRRPVLIVSPNNFNSFTNVPVILPITNGGDFARRAGLSVSLDGYGLKTTGIVRCDQPRAVDMTERHGRKVESVPQALIDEVLEKVLTLFD